jgi:hypothetical protein
LKALGNKYGKQANGSTVATNGIQDYRSLSVLGFDNPLVDRECLANARARLGSPWDWTGNISMTYRRLNFLFGLLIVGCGTSMSSAQESSPQSKQAVQQAVAELKQSVADNKAKLAQYQWTQTTQVSVKGEVKKNEQSTCRYTADGKVQKTPIGPPPEHKAAPHGLKGKIVEKKVDEMKDYMESLQSLIGHYAPPDPQKMQAAMQSGKAHVDSSGGVATVSFDDYYKQGDKLSLAFDTAAKKIRSYNVNTYLDDPKEVVTLNNQFADLTDGTNYLQQTVLDAKSKQIQIKTTNADYVPLSH